MRRSWFWHTSEYLIQTWRVIPLQNDSNCCSLKAAFYQKLPFSWSFLVSERNLLWEAVFCLASWYQVLSHKGAWGAQQPGSLLEGAGPSPQQRVPLAGCGRQERRNPQEDVGNPCSDRGSHRRHGVGSQLSKTFLPSPCCYPRALSWLKQSFKAGSCQPGQKGKLSAKPFHFGSALPNHFKFLLCKMWDIVVHIQIQCGFWNPMALPLGRSLSQLWPTQGLKRTFPLPSFQG